MGPITTEHDYVAGAANLTLMGGPQFGSPFYLLSILYQRAKTDAINIFVECIYKGNSLTIDSLGNTGEKKYVFPNSRVPYPIALPDGARIVFRTTGTVAADELQGVLVQYAQGM